MLLLIIIELNDWLCLLKLNLAFLATLWFLSCTNILVTNWAIIDIIINFYRWYFVWLLYIIRYWFMNWLIKRLETCCGYTFNQSSFVILNRILRWYSIVLRDCNSGNIWDSRSIYAVKINFWYTVSSWRCCCFLINTLNKAI